MESRSQRALPTRSRHSHIFSVGLCKVLGILQFLYSFLVLPPRISVFLDPSLLILLDGGCTYETDLSLLTTVGLRRMATRRRMRNRSTFYLTSTCSGRGKVVIVFVGYLVAYLTLGQCLLLCIGVRNGLYPTQTEELCQISS
jgi:hypothetical protein